jgi:phage FluMu protein Com
MHAAGVPYLNINCPTCKKTIFMEHFTNVGDIKEFMLSGMCKSCQDGVFGGD